jgi:transcriptional regulator with XRE-family HTH domain
MTDDGVTATRVRAARKRRGWSREELAVRAGLSWAAITQIESGRRTNLRPATVRALAGALDVTTDYLLGHDRLDGSLLEHEALIYADDDAFAESAGDYMRVAVALGEPALAVTSAHNVAVLREQLGDQAAGVTFADSADWYGNPPGALTRYRDYVTRALGAGASWVRVLGEPVWSGRNPAERDAWVRYESLLNLTFANFPATLVCPYNAATVEPDVIAHARATHPHTREHGTAAPSESYTDPGDFLLS